MIEPGALAAIRAGRPGVHVVRGNGDPQPLEAVGVHAIGLDLWLDVRHMDGSEAPPVRASQAHALERTYATEEEA